MKISIDVNGVLRDTLGKVEQIYQKFFIDDYVKEENEKDFASICSHCCPCPSERRPRRARRGCSRTHR